MVFVPLARRTSLMLVVSAAERRFGPAVAGAMAALPVALSIIVLAVGAELGRDAGATLAAAAAAHVVAQVAFALAFAAVITRPAAHSACSPESPSFAFVSLLVVPLPPALAIASPIPALLLRGQTPQHCVRIKTLLRANRMLRGLTPDDGAGAAGRAGDGRDGAVHRGGGRAGGGGGDRGVSRAEHGVRAGAGTDARALAAATRCAG